MDKSLLSALKKSNQAVPPVWLMRQAGRYLPEYNAVRKNAGSFLDLCYTPELASEVTLQPIRRFDFDASIIFSDILVIPHALGMRLDYVNGEGPKLQKIETADDVKTLTIDGAVKKLSPVMEALKLVKKELPETTTLIGFAGAPWTVAAYMIEGSGSKDFATARGFAYQEAKAFKEILEILVEVTSEYLIEQVNNGAEVVQIFDSWAGMVPGECFKHWVLEPTKKIVSNVKKKHPNLPVIGFPKGAGIQYENFVKETGIDGVSIDYSVPLKWAAETLQKHVCIQGNLDPALLANGDEKIIRAEVKKIKELLGNGPHIFNLGHGILPHTPIKNVEILLDAVRG